MYLITGDIHGDLDINRLSNKNWSKGQQLTKEDYLIILGDFGINIYNKNQYSDWISWLNDQPWTTLFVDGNHENFPWLDSLEVKEWNSGKVGIARSNIFHLRRGEVYKINDSTVFTMGGATSIDRSRRTEGINWWKEEIPSATEIDYAVENLNKVNNKVDIVLTHTMPTVAANKFISERYGYTVEIDRNSITEHMFQNMIDHNIIQFKQWYCGHWHPECKWTYLNYNCYYDCIEELNI